MRRAGFQAIEPDNLDSYTRSKGLLTRATPWPSPRCWLARAHRAGLRSRRRTRRNSPAGGRASGFDFAIAEECQVYDECGGYTRRYGHAVIEIEYTDNGRRAFAAACAARGARISIELVDRDVLPAGAPGHVRRFCS